MEEQVSFKSRVRDVAVQNAPLYDYYFVKKSYYLISDAFKIRPYYIVEAEITNYLHLVSVSTSLSAESFYKKCLDASLSETDFDLSFHGKDPKFSKGSIRQKILTLPNMFGILSAPNLVEEDFVKNVVRCSIATSNVSCTLGFIATPSARPMTLLRGDELDHTKSSPLKIVFSKNRNEEKFSNILVGSNEDLVSSYDSYSEMISKNLKEYITSLGNLKESH